MLNFVQSNEETKVSHLNQSPLYTVLKLIQMSKELLTKNKPKRSYSDFYEKAIPIALVSFVILITGILILTLGIAFGLFSIA